MLRLRVIQLQMESGFQEVDFHRQLPDFLNFQRPREILSLHQLLVHQTYEGILIA